MLVEDLELSSNDKVNKSDAPVIQSTKVYVTCQEVSDRIKQLAEYYIEIKK